MKRKNALYSALAGTVALGLILAGCGNQNPTVGEDGKPIVSVQVVKDSRTLKISSFKWSKELEKMCDCHINWLETPAASWDQQKKAALAAGDVADITISGYGSGDMPQYGSLFMDLSKELKNLPNLSKAFEKSPYARVVSTTSDGKLLGTPRIANEPARSSNHLFINKQWLDKLGLSVPTTWDEFKKVLEAFKTQDPNGNGKHDEIPLDLNSPGTDGFGTFSANVFLGSEGITISNGGLGLYAENGKIKSYLTDPRYKKLIKYLNSLWKEGLISQEFFTHDWSKYTGTAKGSGNTAVVGASIMWTPSDLFGTTLGPQYVTIPQLKADANQTEKPVWTYNGDDLAYSAYRAVVSNKVANKKAALKLLDAFYSPSMSVQMSYGDLGKCVKKVSDTEFTILPPSDKSKNSSDWQFINSLGDRSPVDLSSVKLNLPAEQSEYQKTDKVYDKDFANMDLNKDVIYSNMPQTKDQSTKLSKYSTGINQNSMSKFAQWATKGGVDEQWDAYVSSLKKNHLDEVIKINQDIYDSYTQKMSKLDVNLNSLGK